MNKKNNPLVTVYITNYNYAKFISKAIESLINQTYNNIELVIIEDGSDTVKEYVEEISNTNNLKVIYDAAHAFGVIVGFGLPGYDLAVQALLGTD